MEICSNYRGIFICLSMPNIRGLRNIQNRRILISHIIMNPRFFLWKFNIVKRIHFIKRHAIKIYIA